jgi:hypothetical protein
LSILHLSRAADTIQAFVCLQGYYHFNPHEKVRFDVYKPDINSQHDPSRDATIRQIYKKRLKNWSAFRCLKWQLPKVPEQLTVTKGEDTTACAVADPEADPADILTHFEETYGHLNLTGSAGSAISAVSVSGTLEPAPEPQEGGSVSGSSLAPCPIAEWDISDVAVLESLATQYLGDDIPAQEANALVKKLLGERQLLLLHASSQDYLTNKLLPGLKEGNQSRLAGADDITGIL